MTNAIPAVPIPADLYDAALAFCNERRAEAGLEPWTELPAGKGVNPGACPCSQSVPGLMVYEKLFYIGSYRPHDERQLHNINGFIKAFDLLAPSDCDCLPVRTEAP